MDSASIGSSKGTSSPMQSPAFEVALAYQDLPTGLHARELLDHVLEECQLRAEFNLTLWKLEMFHVPEISEQSVLAACKADLVLLSMRGDIGLETNTERWLKQWITQRHEECALAVLIDCNIQRMDSMGQTLFQLQDLTRSSQVRLFIGFVPSISQAPVSTGNPESEHTETILAPRHDVPKPDHPNHEGGIND